MLKGLTNKIIISNLFGIPLIFVALLVIDSGRTSLTDLQIQSMFQQAQTLAGLITERAAGRYDYENDRLLRPYGSQQGFFLRQPLIADDTTAILFDDKGNIIEDSRRHLPGKITVSPLMPIGYNSEVKTRYRILYEKIFRFFFQSNVTNYLLFSDDEGRYGSDFIEFQQAIIGNSVAVIRINQHNKTFLSVGVPVKRVGKVLGVLKLSSSNEKIAQAVMREREILIQLLMIAILISVIISYVLSKKIASPLEKLTYHIGIAEKSNFRPDILKNIDLRKSSKRQDEIGTLSQSFERLMHTLASHFQDIERFAADVSHELKNPLTSLKSALDTMEYVNDVDKKQQLLKVAKHDILRMDRLIGDISNLSRIDAEMKRENYTDINLVKLLKDLAVHYNEGALAKNSQIIINTDQNKIIFSAIANRLGYAFSNIIENALSFVSQENGSIVIDISENTKDILIQITDNGIGIPENALDKIFERFYSDRDTTNMFGKHSGLGLSIVKRIIEAHDGKITAHNRIDGIKGAVFKIQLPKL